MRAARGLGRVYQPTYRERKTGNLKRCSTWWVEFWVDGRRVAENAHSTNRADAVRLLRKRIADIADGRPVGSVLSRTTLRDLLAMVEGDYAANSRRSIERVRYAARNLSSFFRAERKARDITADRITAYAAHRLGAGAKPATVNYEMAVLRRGFRLGVRAGKVGLRPEIQMLHVDNARKGFFEFEQFRAVLARLPDYLKPVATVAYITGWRVQSELLTRQWRHLDFLNGWMRLEPGETKNGDGREFPYTPELRAVLEMQRERVHAIELRRGQVIPWIFCHDDGTRIRDFRYTWAKVCKAAGVPGRLVHDFRRTAVRNLERAGVARSAAMKMTGHKTEAIYRRYAITDAAMLQEAAIKLAALHASESSFDQNRESNAKVRP